MTFRENDTALLRFSEKNELALRQFHGYLLTKEISREGWQHLAAAAPVSQREKALQPMSQRQSLCAFPQLALCNIVQPGIGMNLREFLIHSHTAGKHLLSHFPNVFIRFQALSDMKRQAFPTISEASTPPRSVVPLPDTQKQRDTCKIMKPKSYPQIQQKAN